MQRFEFATDGAVRLDDTLADLDGAIGALKLRGRIISRATSARFLPEQKLKNGLKNIAG